MSEKKNVEVIYVAPKPHGFGILDWLQDSFLMRLLRPFGVLAIIFGVYGFMLDLGDRRAARETDAWQVLTTHAPGNSGKIQALEYLNSDTSLSIANPRTWKLPFGWTIPLGPASSNCGERDAQGKVPDKWVLICDFGPFKTKTVLMGIDLSGTFSADEKKWVNGIWLVGVKLPSAMLVDTHFEGANLSDAHFEQADLDGAHLDGAFIDGADFGQASLFLATMKGAFISGSQFAGAGLQYADLRGATLLDSDFADVNFGWTDLRGAVLTGSLFNGADFKEAALVGADLAGVDLGNARNLTQNQVDFACVETDTLLPKGIVARQPKCKRDGDRVLLNENGYPVRDTPPKMN
jgi:uncharacterized protein YjbI with pentapeptide repeats